MEGGKQLFVGLHRPVDRVAMLAPELGAAAERIMLSRKVTSDHGFLG